MKENYEIRYSQIVQGMIPPVYRTPEEQGNSIEKCTILKPVDEIEYSSVSKEHD